MRPWVPLVLALVACAEPPPGSSIVAADDLEAAEGDDGAVDPGGFRALNLRSTAAVWGQPFTLMFSGAVPNESIVVFRSRGSGPGPCPAQFGGMCLDITSPLTVIAAPTTDATGAWEQVINLPPTGPVGLDMYVQVGIARGAGGVTSVKSGVLTVPIDTAPVAEDDAYETSEGVQLSVAAPGYLANDFDADGDALTMFIVDQPLNGNVMPAADGSFEYIPVPGFNGVDTFTYQLTDGVAASALATVTITVGSVNNAPVAGADSVRGLDEDVVFVLDPADSLLLDDVDPEGDPLTAVLATQPPAGQGTVELLADGTFTWSPSPNFAGVTSFTYQAFDGVAYSAAVPVTLTIQSSNDLPTVTGEAYETGRDEPLVVAAPGLLANDFDVDGPGALSALTVAGGDPDHGTVSIGVDGSFTYTPDLCFVGSDSFEYKVSDSSRSSGAVVVDLDVGPSSAPDPAFCDAYEPIVDIETWDSYVFDGFNTTAYVPANPIGLAFLFHGSGGDLGEVRQIEWVRFTNDLIASGVAVVATESTDRATGEWDRGTNVVTNDDFPRLSDLRDDLVNTTDLTASTPIAGIGFSNGAGMVPSFATMALASGWPMSVMSIHNSSYGSTPALPAFFVSCENDDNVSPATMVAAYNAQPAAKEYHEHLEAPIHPLLFTQHAEIDAQLSQDHFDELVVEGLIDAAGVRLVSDAQMESAIDDYADNSPVPQASRVATSIRVAWAMHRFSGEFHTEESAFILNHL